MLMWFTHPCAVLADTLMSDDSVLMRHARLAMSAAARPVAATTKEAAPADAGTGSCTQSNRPHQKVSPSMQEQTAIMSLQLGFAWQAMIIWSSVRSGATKVQPVLVGSRDTHPGHTHGPGIETATMIGQYGVGGLESPWLRRSVQPRDYCVGDGDYPFADQCNKEAWRATTEHASVLLILLTLSVAPCLMFSATQMNMALCCSIVAARRREDRSIVQTHQTVRHSKRSSAVPVEGESGEALWLCLACTHGGPAGTAGNGV